MNLGESLRNGLKARIQAEILAYKYRYDPLAWIADAFGEAYVPAVPKIREAIQNSLTYKYNLLYGTNSGGKSFGVSGEYHLWWIYGRGYENATATVVAPSSRQTRVVYNKYLKTLININHKRFNQGETTIWIDGRVVDDRMLKRGNGLIVSEGRNPIDTGENSNQKVLGEHSVGEETGESGGTLVIIEEADGISHHLFGDAERMVTGSADKLIAVTNPNDPDSFAGLLAKPLEDFLSGHESEYRHGSYCVTQYGWQDMPTNPASPDYDPNIPSIQRDNLLHVDFVDNIESRYPPDDPERKIKIDGRFAYNAERRIITMATLACALDTNAPEDAEIISRPTLGIDLAGLGANKSVAYIKHSIPTEDGKIIDRIRFLDEFTSEKTTYLQEQQAEWVASLIYNTGAQRVYFDSAGIGSIFITVLLPILDQRGIDTDDVLIVPLHGGSRYLDPHVVANDRTGLWYNLQQRMLNGEIDLDAEDEQLCKDLRMVTYDLDNQGRIALTTKKKLPYSPDNGDACVLSALKNEVVDFVMMEKPPKTIMKIAEEEEVDSIVNDYCATEGFVQASYVDMFMNLDMEVF